MDLLSLVSEHQPTPRWHDAKTPPIVLFVAFRTRDFVCAYESLIPSLIQAGLEVHVAASDHPSLARLELAGAKICALAPARPNAPASHLGTLLTLQAYIVGLDIALAHIVAGPWSWVVAWMTRQAGAWVNVVTADDLLASVDAPDVQGVLRTLTQLKPVHQRVEQLAHRVIESSVDVWLCTTMQSFEQAQASFQGTHTQIKVLSGGAGLGSRWAQTARRFTQAEARDLLGVSDWSVVLGAIPRSPQASRTLLHTIELLHARAPQARWVIEADADVIHDVRAFEALGARDIVRFDDRKELARASAFYRALDLFVEVEQRSGSFLTILEAAMAQTPIVSVPRQGLDALLEVPTELAMSPAAHPAALAQHIQRCLEDAPARSSQAQSAYVALAGRFNRAEAMERLMVLYDGLLTSALEERQGSA